MKIVYQNVVLLLFFTLYNYLCLANSPHVITVGALFNNEDRQSKLALDSLIYTTNTMQYAIHYNVDAKTVSNTDSFQCSKILCNMTQQRRGIAGVFGPTSLITTPIVESLCMNLEIPHIQTSWRPTSWNAETDTIINFFPETNLLAHGLSIIVQNLQWKSFAVLYEDHEGLMRLQDVLKLQDYNKESKQNMIVVKQLGPGLDHRTLLKEIQNSTESHIILDCATEHIMNILEQAKEIKMLESFHYYFITSLDAHTLDFHSLNTSANITTVRIFDPDDSDFAEGALQTWIQYANDHYEQIMDLRPYSIKTETVLMHDAVSMFIETVNALHVTGPVITQQLKCDEYESEPANIWPEGLRITSFLKVKSRPNGLSGPINFDSIGRRVNFTLYAVGGTTDVIGKWNPTYPEMFNFTKNQNEMYKQLVKNLQKDVIIVSSRIGEPYLMETQPEHENQILRGNDRYYGYSMDLITAISKILNFTFEFRLAEDGKYGNYDEKTKSWNGLIKDILDHKAQLAICDLTITHQRREVVDFSMPFMRLGISILYKKAEKKDINMFAFMDPFSTEVWIYTATLYLAVSVILFFVSRMAPDDWENPHPCDENPEELENIWDIKNCLWLSLGSIMAQGCDILPKGISSRMASSMWWFFSLIMTSSYTANLAAFLTMERMEPTIDGYEALAKQTKIKYGTVLNGATYAFFKEATYPTFQRMWTTMESAKPSVFEKNNPDGVKRVQTTKQRLYAFFMESVQIEYETETKCDLKQVGSGLDSKGYGIAMEIGYPYRSAIDKAVLDLQESGKLLELKTKWWEKMRKEKSCNQGGASEEAASSKLALANVGGVFLVLGVGVAVAYLIAILEFLWKVRNVSVEEHMTYWQALKVEIMFALNVWITKKRVKPQTSESSSGNSVDLHSTTHSLIQATAGSFINLDILNKSSDNLPIMES